MNRRDDVNKLYKQSNALQRISLIFYWCNILAGFASPFLPASEIYLRIEGIVQGVCALLFLVLNIFDACYYWYEAEAERRKCDISNAFDISLDELTTQDYYHNSLPPSMGKFAANAFESSFFSKEIAQRMLGKVCVKAVCSIIVMIVSSFIIQDPSLLVIIIQAALTAYFIDDAVKLLRYITLVKSVFNSLFRSFITVGIGNRNQELNAFTNAFEYEAIKAHFQIRLDTKLFSKHNQELSSKWEEMSSKIRYSLEAEIE